MKNLMARTQTFRGLFARLTPVVLLAAVTTVFLAGCGGGGGGGGQTVGQVDAASNVASPAAAPSLGTEQSFAVLGGSTVTNTGSSVITGNLGLSPGLAVTGFPPGIVNGEIHVADAVALQAQTDTTTLYNNLAG